MACGLIVVAISACKKPTALLSSNVSNADAATMLAGSLSANSYGLTNISTDIGMHVNTAMSSNQACGSTVIDTVTRRSVPGADVSYSYKLTYSRKLTCNTSSQPDNVSSNLAYSGFFSNSALSITNSGTAVFTVAGLTTNATAYVLNGEYKSSGSFKLKPDTAANNGSASVDIVVKNINVSKATQVINSGTATVIVTGTTVKKGDFTYNGTLTFNGNFMATLTLNGSNYTINLATGTVAKK